MKRYKMQLTMNIIKRLENYRLERKISQEALAKKLGVAFSTVNRWLNAKSKPSKIQTYHITKLLSAPSSNRKKKDHLNEIINT